MKALYTLPMYLTSDFLIKHFLLVTLPAVSCYNFFVAQKKITGKDSTEFSKGM